MEQSLFLQWVQKYFPGLVIRVVQTLNGTKTPLTYLHRRMLTKNYSVTGKWESLSAAFTLVMADVVAMDSSLPLKKRDSVSKASGDIPKMGIELNLNERQLSDLNVLVQSGAANSQIIAKLFADTPRCIGGIYERNEAIFLEGLSTGYAVIDDTENVGTGIRLNYGYLAANKFGVTVLWASSPTTATPLDDIQRVMDKAEADGNVISTVKMDKTAFNRMAGTTQVKDRYAFSIGFVGTKTPPPNLDQFNNFSLAEYGWTVEIINRSVTSEKNGVKTIVKPWATGIIAFLPGDNIGELVWATLAEQTYPAAGVVYQTVDDFILASKFRVNRPSLKEFTSAQARCVPVIGSADSIYLLDSGTVQA